MRTNCVRSIIVFTFLLLVFADGALADEGMWTFDNLPLDLLRERYSFVPTQAWADHVRRSCVRLSDGGSGAFVSPYGLLLTNHHVILSQLQNRSTPLHDYVSSGFYADSTAKEMRLDNLDVDVLESTENVSEPIRHALQNIGDQNKALAIRQSMSAQIERTSTKQTGLRSHVVSLYDGGEYWLYRYKRFSDVRLVFAPEKQVAFFGGDSDNFTYPRYDLDFAFLRVYENDKPVNSSDFFKVKATGATEGELVFVPGNPAATSRQLTVSQLLQQRDLRLPMVIFQLKGFVDTLSKYASKGKEQTRQVGSLLTMAQNGLKEYEGSYRSLLDDRLIVKKQLEEDEFRRRVSSTLEWQAEFGDAWDIISAAQARAAPGFKARLFRQLDSQLFSLSLLAVRYVAESKKPDGERLSGFHESQIESVRKRLLSSVAIYPEMEEARLAGGLEQSKKELGGSDDFVTLVMGGRNADSVASNLIRRTQIADPAFRRALLEGGEPAVLTSQDPMIILAREVDPMFRSMFSWFEDNVQSATQAGAEKLAKARFLAYGHSAYPDATFTLRLSYGTVRGYPMNGTMASYKTTFFGLYDRALSFDSSESFRLPFRYVAGRNKLNLATPLNFVNTCDVVAGSSGSPLINRKGELVGVTFDGNIESLGGQFVYQGETNRTIAVHIAAILEVLHQLYGGGRVVREVEGQGK